MDKLTAFGGVIAMTFALTMNRIFDGVGRPTFGWISDKIGRENTMCLAFTLGAVMLYVLSQNGSDPAAFVIAIVLYFGVSGEIYSLFPATSGDTFGVKYATTNNGMLYTAKGTASSLRDSPYSSSNRCASVTSRPPGNRSVAVRGPPASHESSPGL